MSKGRWTLVILLLLLGIAIGSLLGPVPARPYLIEAATLILDKWEGPGERPGLYYDRTWARAQPDKPYRFYEVKDLGYYGLLPPGQREGFVPSARDQDQRRR